MAMPENELSTNLHEAEYLEPDNRDRGLLNDFEYGGIALNDPTEGLRYQVWELRYNNDKKSPNYGDFTIHPELVGSPVQVLNVANVLNCGLAFDQNMNPFICYELTTGESKFWWFDTTIPGTTTNTLPATSISPRCCLDDHRITQDNSSDIVLAYTRNNSLYMRLQRDRYATEYLLDSDVPKRLVRVGMNAVNRLQFDLDTGQDNRLCDIVRDLCENVGIKNEQLNLTELCPTEVRGYMVSSLLSSAEAIRGLQRVYFFDMPEIDGQLHGLMRGRDIVETINHDDIVIGQDVVVETAREMEIEFPKKMHLSYACAESDYTPTKQTSERRSTNVEVRSEINVECFVNLHPNEAKQRSTIMHKEAWTELEGKIKFGVSEEFAHLVPSNVVSIEVKPNQFKRARIIKYDFVDGVFEMEAIIDRKSNYELLEAESAVEFKIGGRPPSSKIGTTVWEFLDIPALKTAAETDQLHYYVAAYGTANAWNGAQLQREIGTEYQNESTINSTSTMGDVFDALPLAPSEIPDTTNEFQVDVNRQLFSTTDDLLLTWVNAAVIDNEIIQFRDVTQLAGEVTATHTGTNVSFEREVFTRDKILRSAGSWLTDGFVSGVAVTVSGSTSNDGTYNVIGVQNDAIILDGQGAIVDEAEGASITVSQGVGFRYKLGYLLRGRLDTVPAAHGANARFVMLDNPTLVPAAVGLLGETFNLRAPAFGTVAVDATPQNVTFTGKSQREWAPVDLVANQSGSDWVLSWQARHRYGDNVQPVPSVHFLGWRLKFTVGATTVTHDIEQLDPSYTWTSAQQTTDFGSNQSSFDIEIMGINAFTGEGNSLSESI